MRSYLPAFQDCSTEIKGLISAINQSMSTTDWSTLPELAKALDRAVTAYCSIEQNWVFPKVLAKAERIHSDEAYERLLKSAKRLLNGTRTLQNCTKRCRVEPTLLASHWDQVRQLIIIRMNAVHLLSAELVKVAKRPEAVLLAA
jgi:hypothetical protein